jgi:hypothetical protein
MPESGKEAGPVDGCQVAKGVCGEGDDVMMEGDRTA